MSLTDDSSPGSLVVVLTPYYDEDKDGMIDVDQDCAGLPVTYSISNL